MKMKEKKGSKAVMEVEKRSLLRDREPLSDSTNLTTAARATLKPNLSSIFTKSLPRKNPSANLNDANDVRNPSSASTPSRPVKASSAHGNFVVVASFLSRFWFCIELGILTIGFSLWLTLCSWNLIAIIVWFWIFLGIVIVRTNVRNCMGLGFWFSRNWFTSSLNVELSRGIWDLGSWGPLELLV